MKILNPGKRNSFLCILWPFFGITISCSSLDRSEPQKDTVHISWKTEIPPQFPLESNHQPSWVVIPQDTVFLAEITSSAAEVRDGPSAIYAIKDRLLRENDEVVLLDDLQTWLKIYCPKKTLSGWVHSNVVSEKRRNKTEMTLPLLVFSKIFAIQKVNEIYHTHGKAPLSVNIPKGRGFPLLAKMGSFNLGWIAETNSLAWFPAETVQ